MQACGVAGVKCLEDAPRWDQRHTWAQAFTCNSVAGVRMISSMVPTWDIAATISFSTGPCAVVQSVLAALVKVCELRTDTLLTDAL